jgi:hypothetical protein
MPKRPVAARDARFDAATIGRMPCPSADASDGNPGIDGEPTSDR